MEPGNVFITDRDNHRVVKITPSGVQTTVPTSGVQLPYYPAVDAAGDVFFLDAGTELVLKVTPGGVQSTVPISIPGEGNGVAVDAAGDVFVSDQINNVVLEVSPSGVQTTVPTTGLNIPAGLAVDAAGNLFIAVNGQTRVVKVNRSQPPSLNFALTNVGSTSADSPQIATLQNVGNQPLSGTATFNSGTSFSVGLHVRAHAFASSRFQLFPEFRLLAAEHWVSDGFGGFQRQHAESLPRGFAPDHQSQRHRRHSMARQSLPPFPTSSDLRSP